MFNTLSSKPQIKCPQKPVVFLMGPTASGKTALAIELYQTGNYEIISVDSALIYQQMDIGSAKPSADELARAPHHLIDFLDPTQSYSAANFCDDAIELINQIHDRGKVPLLVGGTMLYFKALRDGLADLPSSDPALRQQLSAEMASKGVEQMHQRLSEVDPITANRLKTTDSQRILRALEVWHQSQKPLSWWHQQQQLSPLPNPLLAVALAPAERTVLHQRIAKRFEIMMAAGFLQEVERLYQRANLSLESPSMKCVGYRQLWLHLDGQYELDEAVERAIIATRQLAKRQYTWLRRWPDLQWIDTDDPAAMKKALTCINAFIEE